MKNARMTICALTLLFSADYVTAGTWTTLNVPGAEFTRAHGIDGSNIVGDYFDGSTYHGFLYDGTTWITLDMPGATVEFGTGAYGIDGSNIVGASGDHGFLYNGTTWTTLEMPGASITWAWGISGKQYCWSIQ